MSVALTIATPWRDRTGAFSGFKLAVLIALCLPGLMIGYEYAFGPPAARPLTEAIHSLGLWSVRLLLISLALTPLRQIGKWPRIALVRRMVGVGAFTYVALHFAVYIIDLNGNLLRVGSEIILRFYLTIGFVALAILLALAVTSTDGMLRRLGGRRWQRLHRLSYLAAALGITHYFLQIRGDVSPAIWMAGLGLWLMVYRVILWRWESSRAAHPAMVLLTGWLCGLVTMAGEVVYLTIRTNAPVMRLVMAQVNPDFGIRPGWIVLAVLTAAAGLALARRNAGRGRRA